MKTRAVALLLAALMLLALPPVSGAADGEALVLCPAASEGVEISEVLPGSMSIEAHIDGESVIFDETKLIAFDAFYAEGWLACKNYSHFFPNDARASQTVRGDGVCEFRFSAQAGGSVSLAEWCAVAVNASCTELPRLCIDAAADFADIGKEEWVEASFTLTLGSKHFESGDYEGEGYVKGRGNYSWNQPKKPYSIKLSSKASLLDIPKTKKYAVVPGYSDPSLLRNYITYKGYQGLEGIGYVPKCEFVDVYLNGVYNGVYLLVERVDIEKNKINLEEADAENMTGGYLIEKDIWGRFDYYNDLWFSCPYWANEGHDYFVLKTPEPEDNELASAMRAYLADYMQRLHAAVMGTSGESYLDYVDTSSWVDFIIVQEIAKNIDGNMKTSCFMYKDRDDEHLYMTAPWDFDLAYGRVSWNNQSEAHNDVYDCPNANTYDGFMILNSSNPWMDRLYDTRPEFRAALMQRYTAYRHTLIDGLFAMIDEQAAYLAVVQLADSELWNNSFNTGVRMLKTWLAGRLDWLDSQWLWSGCEQGDVDMDLAVNANDALLALRAALGLVALDPVAAALADMNGDGEVNANDALAILRLVLGVG